MLTLSDDELSWLNSVECRKDLLGQIFTPLDIAELMVSMALESQPKTILDPCFGEGIFLKVLHKHTEGINIKKIGIEIDPKLYEKVNNKFPNIELYNGDFFNFHGKVDSIIMNPPYIRQELLNDEMPKFLNKNEILNRLPLSNNYLSPRSNLYIYFIVKSWGILQETGEIVAIIPNTWMTAEYGQSFKSFILDKFWIKKIIQFKKDVFPNADVDSCIIHLQKNKKALENHTKMITIKEPLTKNELININSLITNQNSKLFIREVSQKKLFIRKSWFDFFNQNKLFDHEDRMIALYEVADIKRGITTNYNDFFIINDLKFVKKYPQYFTEILCSPKDIEGLTTKTRTKKCYLFFTQQNKEKLPLDLKTYVENYERKIINESRPKTLYNKIINKPNEWYKIKSVTVSPLLFSYIIRNQKRFILNEDNLISRDNFYEITPKNKLDELILFAILNSRITSLFLEDIGRSHGKGLLKIQKYELEKLKIVNPHIIEKQDLIMLVKLGKALTNIKLTANIQFYIQKIDEILLPYVSTMLRVKDVESILNRRIKSRLNRRNGYLKLVRE